ncbi:MAG: AraC family transcriptional regulator [Defluviitaleaceae bacterium]|nr:AraC family transcriptional regulator [Defluviitaleaceae bacterium]
MRYYKRILFLYLSISVVFALLVEGVFLFSNISTQKKSYEDSLASVSRQFCENTDFYLATGIQCATLIKSSDSAARYLQKSGSVQYNRLLLFRYLQTVYGAAPGRLNAIAISTFEDDYVIRTDGTGYISNFLDRFNMTSSQLEKVLDSFQPGYISQTAFLTVTAPNGGKQYIMALSEPTIYSVSLYVFISYTEDQLFEQNLLGGGEGCALFYNDEIIAAVGDYTNDQFAAYDKGNAPRSLNVREIGSSSDGFRYLFVAKAPHLFTLSLWLIIGLGLVLLACLILIMVTLARRMYLPIRELLYLSGSEYESDEFAFLKQRMISLFENIDSMSHSLTQYDGLVENALYFDLLNGNMTEGKFSDALTRFLPGGEQGPFVVALLRYNQSSPSQPDFSQDMIYFLKQKVDLYLSPIMENRDFAKKVDLSFDTIALILSCADTAALAAEINEALLMAESEYKLDFTASIGTQETTLLNLPRSYREAQNGLETGQLADRKVITRGAPANLDAVYFPINTEQAILRALSRDKEDAWKSIIEDIVSTNETKRQITVSALATLFTVCLRRICDALQQNPETLFGDSLTRLASEVTFQDLKLTVFNLFGTFSEKIRQDDKKPNPSAVKKMLEFIEENYNRDISLSDLATHLGLSKNYVSTLFKTAVGSNFKDYLNNARFRKACQLFQENPGRKIKDVAEAVGCNKDILARLFIRYIGILPSDYQERLLKK